MREKAARRSIKPPVSFGRVPRKVASTDVRSTDVRSTDVRSTDVRSTEPESVEARSLEARSLDPASMCLASVSSVASGARSRRQPCAIIVDDDPEVGRALARQLGPELDVHLAATVAQAEAVLARLERVDVAFVDFELPDGSGETILEQLSRWPDAIRVLISGRLLVDDNTLKNRALANLVLRKPVSPQIIEALKRAALALPNG
jgi:CheY-like chemotaxis protein